MHFIFVNSLLCLAFRNCQLLFLIFYLHKVHSEGLTHGSIVEHNEGNLPPVNVPSLLCKLCVEAFKLIPGIWMLENRLFPHIFNCGVYIDITSKSHHLPPVFTSSVRVLPSSYLVFNPPSSVWKCLAVSPSAFISYLCFPSSDLVLAYVTFQTTLSLICYKSIYKVLLLTSW